MVADFVSADYGWLPSAMGNDAAPILFKVGKACNGYLSGDKIPAPFLFLYLSLLYFETHYFIHYIISDLQDTQDPIHYWLLTVVILLVILAELGKVVSQFIIIRISSAYSNILAMP